MQGPFTVKGGCVGKGPTDTEIRTAAFNRKGEVNPFWDPLLVAGLALPFQPMDTLRQVELERNDPQKLIARIQPTRTEHFTDELLQNMDMQNLYRMARLSPMAQDLVIKFYTVPRGGVRDQDSFTGTIVRGLRDMLVQGVPMMEVVRFMSLLDRMDRTGGKGLSYRPCREFGGKGYCRKGDSCNHMHVFGLTEHVRDTAKGNQVPKGKGKGKHTVDAASLAEWYD